MSKPDIKLFLITRINKVFPNKGNAILRNKIADVTGNHYGTVQDLVLSDKIKAPEFTRGEIARINGALEGYRLRTGLTERQLNAYVVCYQKNYSTVLFNKIAENGKLPKKVVQGLTEKGIVTYLDLFLKTKQELKDECGLSDETITEIEGWAATLGLYLGLAKLEVEWYCKRERKITTGAMPRTLTDAINITSANIAKLSAQLSQEAATLQEMLDLQKKNNPADVEYIGLARILVNNAEKKN